MRQRVSERFEQKNFFDANKFIVGIGAVGLGLLLFNGSWMLMYIAVPLIAYKALTHHRRGTVVEVTNTHLKITEKGWEKKIRWDEISKSKATQASIGGFTIDRVLRFKEGKKRHTLVISELENEDAFLANYMSRTA